MTDRFGKVAVLMGGQSAEREISLLSGAAVLDGLRNRGVDASGVDAGADIVDVLRAGRFDRVWNALHGGAGENGVLQGALETMGLPYTGSGVLGCALAMDKLRTKQVWQTCEVPTPRYRAVHVENELDGVIDELGLPLFVKPNAEGSSIGVSRVEVASELIDAWQLAAASGGEVLIEQMIDGDELTVSILHGEALPVIRLKTPRTFYDYSAKYESDSTDYLCPSGLDAALEADIQALALRAFAQLGCSGWGRVDAMLDRDGKPHLLEVNTVPGMTSHSLVPMAAQQRGIDFDELVVRILETSL